MCGFIGDVMVARPSTCSQVYVARVLLNTRLAQRRENNIYDAGCLKVCTNKQDTTEVLFIIRNATIVRKDEHMTSHRQGSTSKNNKV